MGDVESGGYRSGHSHLKNSILARYKQDMCWYDCLCAGVEVAVDVAKLGAAG